MNIRPHNLRPGQIIAVGTRYETVRAIFDQDGDDVTVVTDNYEYRFDCMSTVEVFGS